MEEQQGAGLKSLIRPFGKKNVALRNQWLLILDTKDPGIKGVLGNSRIDRLAGYLEERKRLPFGIKITAVDRCQSAALLSEGRHIGAIKLKLGAAQDPRNNHSGIETKQLQIDRVAGFGTFQNHFAKFNAPLDNLPTSGIGHGEGRTILQFRRWRLR